MCWQATPTLHVCYSASTMRWHAGECMHHDDSCIYMHSPQHLSNERLCSHHQSSALPSPTTPESATTGHWCWPRMHSDAVQTLTALVRAEIVPAPAKSTTPTAVVFRVSTTVQQQQPSLHELRPSKLTRRECFPRARCGGRDPRPHQHLSCVQLRVMNRSGSLHFVESPTMQVSELRWFVNIERKF
jgi:hypothetical protein